MKILIVGGGGREHALAWKVAQSDRVEQVYVAPGNAGTAMEEKTSNITIPAEDMASLLDFAQEAAIDLTIIGPEGPLVQGIVDRFERSGLSCFGPTRAAAVLEGSKSFSKDFLRRHHIPTADYAVFSEFDKAARYIKSCSFPLVIKADGLAAGKGVIIAQTEQAALDAAHAMLTTKLFGDAGRHILIEEFLVGEEASFIVIADGQHVLPLASSRDHKPRDDGDQGPNTGGMGAYSPAPIIDERLYQRIMQTIILPTIQGMALEGRAFKGFLYTGLMITREGEPKVLEFNCRCGDPETQAILPRMQTDLVPLCLAACQGGLGELAISWDPRVSLVVVSAAAGYPGQVSVGDVIKGLPDQALPALKVFHAGTARREGALVSSGGRVLGVATLGDTLEAARQTAYARLQQIDYKGKFYRRDIGLLGQ